MKLLSSDAGSNDAEFRTGIDAVIAGYVRGQLVDRLTAARKAARATRPGYREGRKPYGTRPGELETVERIRGMRAQGMAYEAIAVLLNDRWCTGTGWKVARELCEASPAPAITSRIGAFKQTVTSPPHPMNSPSG